MCSGKSYNDRLALDFNTAVYLVGRKEIFLLSFGQRAGKEFQVKPHTVSQSRAGTLLCSQLCTGSWGRNMSPPLQKLTNLKGKYM